MYLIREKRHTGNNYGCLWHLEEEYDDTGNFVGIVANYMGNAITDDIRQYLEDNDDISVIDRLPDGVSVKF